MNRKYYIVHLLDDFSGSPKVLSSLIEYLYVSNENVDVLVGGKSEGFISAMGKKCTRYFYSRAENRYITLITYLLSQLHLFFVLCYKFYRDRDLSNKKLIVNTLLPFGAALAAKLMGVKVIYYLHETSINPRVLKWFLLKVVEITSDKIIFVSKFVCNDLCLNVESKNIIYNPLPLEYESITLNGNELFEAWRNKSVIMACSLKDYKGIPEFVLLAKELPGFNFTLIVNDNIENAAHYFSKMKLSSNFFFVCRPESLLGYYRTAFLCFNLSDQNCCVETFGLTLIEAMSAYTPVICPLVGGPIEVVRNYEDGYHIDSKNTTQIVNRIIQLSLDYSLWSDLSLSAKERSRFYSMNEYRISLSSVLFN